MQQLLDGLQVIVAVLSAIAGLLPLYGRSENWKLNRWVIALVAMVCAVALWPTGPAEYCRWRLLYILLAVILALLSAGAWFAQWSLRHRYGHTQLAPDDGGRATNQVLGGPKLTPAAVSLQSLHREWTTQEIFEKLGCDPAKMWEAKPRRRTVRVDMALEFVRGCTTILAIVATSAYIASNEQIKRMYRPLTITPGPEVQLRAQSLAFEADVNGCDREVMWRVDGPEGRAVGQIGESNGIYTPPAEIKEPYDVYVTAFWRAADERKRVTVHLQPPPDYVDTEVVDIPTSPDRPPTRVVVQIIDQRYSWVYNDRKLAGPEDGPAFARRMAADNLLDGYEDLVCIGAASREYVSKREVDQENLARDRARLLATWVRTAVRSTHVRVHALKVGRYNDDTRLFPEATARERQVVLVGVSHPGHDVDLIPTLREAFASLREKQPLLGMYLDHYPLAQWELKLTPVAPRAE